ncbi:MAG: carbon storage regulator [Planctomycetaceae bacterium]|nr:carbon storage regulator [Planctomycetaceae bacterium]MBP63321.1 carbon storage regulator [Planctomycetaceae bacterium]
MLVLSRKRTERIKLTKRGESIVITIIHVGGEKVRIGIQAPTDVLVLREEVISQGK